MRGGIAGHQQVNAAGADRNADDRSEQNGLGHAPDHLIVLRFPAGPVPLRQANQATKRDEGRQVEPWSQPADRRHFHAGEIDEAEQVDNRHLAAERGIALLSDSAPRRRREVDLQKSPDQFPDHHRARFSITRSSARSIIVSEGWSPSFASRMNV